MTDFLWSREEMVGFQLELAAILKFDLSVEPEEISELWATLIMPFWNNCDVEEQLQSFLSYEKSILSK